VLSKFTVSKNRSAEILCLAKNLSWPRVLILWDELGQVFKVSDLLNGVYGCEEWMKQLMAIAQ